MSTYIVKNYDEVKEEKPKRTANGGPLTNNPQFPIPTPEPVEIADAVLTASDIEKMKKAEEKRIKKLAKKNPFTGLFTGSLACARDLTKEEQDAFDAIFPEEKEN